MNYDTVFLALNLGVMPAWALLILAPRASLTRQLVHSFFYALIYGAVYAAALGAALFFSQSADGANMSSISGVTALFSHPVGVITGWTHYLVFDLFVGSWIARDAARRNVSHWFVVPCLILTLVFGPLGLLLYAGYRTLSRRNGALDENN